MNLYVFLWMGAFWIAGVTGGRGEQAQEFWKRYQLYKERKAQENNPGRQRQTGRLRSPRDPSLNLNKFNKIRLSIKRNMGTTSPPPPPTTKSIEQLLEAKKREDRWRNPKGYRVPKTKVPSLKERIKELTEKLRKLKVEKCSTNADCLRRSNNTCCLIHIKSKHGVCSPQPRHYNQQCSDFCPCSGGHKDKMECKVKELTIKGKRRYKKRCLRIKDPESVNKDLLELLKRAKGGRGLGIPINGIKKKLKLKNVSSGKS